MDDAQQRAKTFWSFTYENSSISLADAHALAIALEEHLPLDAEEMVVRVTKKFQSKESLTL